MHTYDFHIGDYSRDTGHLSLLEHGVYRLLLDRAYSDEAPLTANTAILIRKLGAKTAAEQKAVETILTEFFTETPEGWIHKRVEQELEEARGRSLKSKHSQVLRWWRHNKWPNEPTLLDYMQNPAAYHDPITGHIRQPNAGNTVVYEPNSYQPPTANRQPPTATKDNTPLIPQGGNTLALIASGSQSSTETPPAPQAKSEATASPKKRKGRAVGSPEAEAIYALYPRKKEPDTALRAIQKRLDNGIPAADLLQATRLFAAATATWTQHDREFIPYPASWFNAGSFKENPADWLRSDTAKEPTRPTFTTPETARETATSLALTATTPGSGPEGWQDAMEALEGPGWHIGITGWLDLSGPQRQRVIEHLNTPAA
jgi:uncharacterized protein YdaU (DUF1376 family)